MPDEHESAYIHGTDPVEQARLSRLNDLLNRAALLEMKPGPGERILDVGSGLGQFTRAMARAVGAGGRVVGIEKSPEQLAEARRQARAVGEEQLAEFREGDAFNLPLAEDEWGSFDVAHTRFLLEHVPNPLDVVRGMVRAIRPGGRIVLEDDDHEVIRLWPEPPGLRPLWEAYMRTYDRLGNDPYVGRRLVSLLHQAGALPRRNSWLFFGGCAGDPNFDVLVANFISILQGARATMLAHDLIEPALFEQTIDQLHAWGRRPDAALWFAVCWAEGVRPL